MGWLPYGLSVQVALAGLFLGDALIQQKPYSALNAGRRLGVKARMPEADAGVMTSSLRIL
jgi:hypothetical protein